MAEMTVKVLSKIWSGDQFKFFWVFCAKKLLHGILTNLACPETGKVLDNMIQGVNNNSPVTVEELFL